MPQSGYTPIRLYYSTSTGNVPAAGNLSDGELAINLVDGRLFYLDSTIVKVLGWSPPVTKTTDFVLAPQEDWIINNKSGSACVVTLPPASSFIGRQVKFLNYQAQTVDAATSVVVPITGGAAGTSILTATAGKWATLVSDGSNWVIMQAN